jgi:hypothetical protein
VGVDYGGGHIVVPEQWLNGADVGAALQQVGGEGTTTVRALMCFVRPARRTATVMAWLMTLGST